MIKRDIYNKAVIATDAEALNKYKTDRLYYRKINMIQDDMVEIKETVFNICKRIEALEKKQENG
jgi:hypothetical protein